MLEVKQGVGTGDRTMTSKNTNVPCRFSCTQGAVKTWESGDDGWAQESPWGALAIVLSQGSSSKQFLVRKDKGTNVAGLGHMVGRNVLLLQGRSCPYTYQAQPRRCACCTQPRLQGRPPKTGRGQGRYVMSCLRFAAASCLRCHHKHESPSKAASSPHGFVL